MAVLSALWQHQDSVYTGQKTSWKWWAMLRLAQVVTMSPEKDQVLSTDSPKAVTTHDREVPFALLSGPILSEPALFSSSLN